MTVNTNRHARNMAKILRPPHYTSSPWQWGYVAAIHPSASTTLSSGCAAGAMSISTVASIAPNSLIVVGAGGPVSVLSVTGSGPFTVNLAGRGVPLAQSGGAVVRTIPTVDVYLDGWQSPPANLPVGVTKVLTTGIRYLSTYIPAVGHVALLGRGTGLQKSDRIVLGRLAAGPNTAYPFFKEAGFSSLGPLLNASSGTIGTFFTFTLAQPTKVRMVFEGDWDSLTAGANQSLVLNLTIDGATMTVAGTFTGQMIDAAAAAIERFRAVGTITLAPGVHTASCNYTVGGGGTAVTLLDNYVEVQAVG